MLVLIFYSHFHAICGHREVEQSGILEWYIQRMGNLGLINIGQFIMFDQKMIHHHLITFISFGDYVVHV